jgi:uncharacterized RDD family membrane protein YckC
MECPRCRNSEFSSEGICLACNYRVEPKETATETESIKNENGNFKKRSAGNQDPPAETPDPRNPDQLPPWRKELTQRLAALKHDNNTGENTGQLPKEDDASARRTVSADINAKPAALPAEHAGTIQVRRQTPKAQPSADQAPSIPPQQKTIASLGPEVYTAPRPADSKNVRELIDSAVSRRPAPSSAETPVFRPQLPLEPENKLILLSRTLSGLIDLIFIVLCTGVFIIAADYFSGIVILDAVSLVEYTGLFLMIFFLYSIFFLAASGQTVGMMITDLRIIGIEGSHPSIGKLLVRCFGFLLSIIVFGAGLLWSLFDRENMCFHDRLSNTSVTRL